MEITRKQTVGLLDIRYDWLHKLIRKGEISPVRYDGINPLFDLDQVMELKRKMARRRAGGPILIDGVPHYRGSQAARYLGISRALFSYHRTKGHIVPDRRWGKNAVYRALTLEIFDERRRSGERW